MFDNEVLITEQDKNILLSNIKGINDILNKYPCSSDYNLPLVTVMSRAKGLANESENWIKLLYTESNDTTK